MAKSVKGFAVVEEQDEFAPLYSEEALALSFTSRHGGEVRYVAKWNKWFIWDGKCWHEDVKRGVYSFARKLCRDESSTLANMKENAAKKLARDIASAKKRAAVVSLSSEDPKIAATIEQWDTDIMLLNVQNGIVDLRTGKLSPHDPERYMTKIAACEMAETIECPKWLRFLDDITDKNEELKGYLQRIAGYSLTGSTEGQEMFFGYGRGKNGKTTFYRALGAILGDYHETAPMEMLTASQMDRHPTELAKLRGARFVTAIETEEGRAWAEAKLKALTGGDPIPARFMRQDFFEYIPQFKLHVVGNHKPSLRSVDEAIRRRINLIPFNVTIAKANPKLLDDLMPEHPGILRWAVEGCLEWKKMKGTRAPEIVTSATETYFNEEDTFAIWFAEGCDTTDKAAWTPSGKLYAAWKAWAEGRNLSPRNSKWFAPKLEAIGLVRDDRREANGFKGVKLRGDGRGPA